MIEKTKDDAKAERGRGKTFPEITYAYKWLEFPTDTKEGEEEFRAANATLTIQEQIKVRNGENQTKARTAALNAALDAAGIEKSDINNDDQYRLKKMFEVLQSTKLYTDEKCWEMAETNCNVKRAE